MIEGWGADLDHKNRPAYPMERIPQRLDVPFDQPARQKEEIEVLMSVEYPVRPAVFGTSVPPSGLSGMIRRAAFKLSENDIRHWLMLIMADRVNVVEGVIEDIAMGSPPNIFAEMGWYAKFKYDTAAAITKVAIITGVLGLGIYYLTRPNEEED